MKFTLEYRRCCSHTGSKQIEATYPEEAMEILKRIVRTPCEPCKLKLFWAQKLLKGLPLELNRFSKGITDC